VAPLKGGFALLLVLQEVAERRPGCLGRVAPYPAATLCGDARLWRGA